MMDEHYAMHRGQRLAGPHFSCAGPRVELEIVRGRAKQARRLVAGPVFMIGSARDCDLVLADERFPDVHSYIYVRREGVTLRHLGDGPQVELDGQQVHMTRLTDGDLLRMGPYTFELHIAWPPGVRGDDHAPASSWETGDAWSEQEAAESEGWRAAQELLADLRLLTGTGPALRVVAEEGAAARKMALAAEPRMRRIA